MTYIFIYTNIWWNYTCSRFIRAVRFSTVHVGIKVSLNTYTGPAAHSCVQCLAPLPPRHIYIHVYIHVYIHDIYIHVYTHKTQGHLQQIHASSVLLSCLYPVYIHMYIYMIPVYTHIHTHKRGTPSADSCKQCDAQLPPPHVCINDKYIHNKYIHIYTHIIQRHLQQIHASSVLLSFLYPMFRVHQLVYISEDKHHRHSNCLETDTSSIICFNSWVIHISVWPTQFKFLCTAYCIWSVIWSQSPISISLVSFQRNVVKET